MSNRSRARPIEVSETDSVSLWTCASIELIKAEFERDFDGLFEELESWIRRLDAAATSRNAH